MDDLFPFFLIVLVGFAFFVRKSRREVRTLRGEVVGLNEKYGTLDRRIVELAAQLGGLRPGEAPWPQAIVEITEPVAEPEPTTVAARTGGA